MFNDKRQLNLLINKTLHVTGDRTVPTFGQYTKLYLFKLILVSNAFYHKDQFELVSFVRPLTYSITYLNLLINNCYKWVQIIFPCLRES